MLALSKPPYLRWVFAVILVVGALAWDLSRQATELAPFAATRIDRGTVLDEDQITWKPVPIGLLPSAIPQGATTLVSIELGEPITSSVVTTGLAVPEGWWTVPVDTPATAIRGSAVRIILAPGTGVPGVVVAPSGEDSFGIMSSGLVAVPEEFAPEIALAAAAGKLTLLYEP